MTPRYRFASDLSRFTVQAHAAGLLSFLGHSPTFVIRELSGTVEFEDDLIAKMKLELTVGAGSLAVTDDLKSSDRREIEDRMRAEVLETGAFPQVIFHGAAADAEKLATGRYRMVLDGTLTLHGVSRPYRGAAELTIFPDGLRLMGATALRMSEFGIAPVTALGGSLRLKDEVNFDFDLAALPEAT
jgi:polyisoprenoid-binding protein YceI